ncbi:hypothetical protein ACWDWO_26825 [Actinopolymorpha singaporensis]
MIDRILIECLGWLTSEIKCEEHYNGEYVDYSLGAPATEAIVEAKKEGHHFVVPVGLEGRRSVDIRSLLEDKDTKKAVNQVLKYCQDKGVPIAILMNGWQLVAFYASRQDGVPPLQGRALLFSSLQEMHDEFETLWNHLSRAGMAKRNLQRALLGKSLKAMPPAKLSDEISSRYPGFRSRSALETDLKTLGGLFLQDLGASGQLSKDFVEKCYCENDALSQYATVSKEILRSRYAALREAAEVEAEPALTRRGINASLLTATTMTEALSRRPLIIVGDVGVGKTMFLRHLIEVEAKDLLNNAYVFYVDFGQEPALADDLNSYVTDVLVDQLDQKYGIDIADGEFIRDVYKRELARFRRGVYGPLAEIDPTQYKVREMEHLASLSGNVSEHLKASLVYLRSKKKRSPVIVLDNIDQRLSDFQDQVFLIAQSLADGWPGTVFVALRPGTLFESKSKGSLAAYQLRVFTVSPARVDRVILRRLVWAREQLETSQETGAFSTQFTINADAMRVYLDMLIKAFDESKELNEIIDNLSGGNLRIALEFLMAFIGSGYVSTRRVLEVAAKGSVYVLPMHELLRAVIYGDYDYYSPSASRICNVFDITSDDGREHFLLCLCLAHIERAGLSAGRNGYLELSNLYEFTQGLGFAQEQVGPQLARAIDKGLIHMPEGRDSGGPFRITTVGSYMYKSMVTRFTYVDAMMVDTPIVDISVRKNIADASTIRERLNRARMFRSYLDREWKNLAGDSVALPFNWEVASSRLLADIEGTEERSERRRQISLWSDESN